ncbi:MAG: hypothetical protein LBO66_01105 [Deltaproteobacteria bacterium]|jgi:hypothetical protein|nr:hypothetical protein [Deltaproteobacteria bacterium]
MKIKTTESATRELIDARVEAIRQARANNLIEGLNMGEDVFRGILERAREPISDEEFERREKILWRQRNHRAAVAN